MKDEIRMKVRDVSIEKQYQPAAPRPSYTREGFGEARWPTVTCDRWTAVGCSSNAPGDATFCPSRLPAEGSGIKVAQRSVAFSVLIVDLTRTNIFSNKYIKYCRKNSSANDWECEDLGGHKCNVKAGPYRVAMYGPGLSSWSDGVSELDCAKRPKWGALKAIQPTGSMSRPNNGCMVFRYV